MSQFVSEVNDGTFEREVLKSDVPVLVDFWAEWCPPCRMLAPTFEELAGRYAGGIKFLKLNVDKNSEVPQRYGIKGIPTLIFFEGGREAERLVGAAGKEAPPRTPPQKAEGAAEEANTRPG